MSFDLGFVWIDGQADPTEQQIRDALSYSGDANAEQQQRIRALAEAIVAKYDINGEDEELSVIWEPFNGGLAKGAWVGGAFPDIEIAATHAFMSSRPDPCRPETLKFYIDLIAFFESLGLRCYDYQRGELVKASEFTFG